MNEENLKVIYKKKTVYIIHLKEEQLRLPEN